MLTNNVTCPGGPCRACGMHGKNRCPTCETGSTTFKNKICWVTCLCRLCLSESVKKSETRKTSRDVGSSKPPFKHYLPFSLAAKFGRLVTEGFIKAICFDRLILRMGGPTNVIQSTASTTPPPVHAGFLPGDAC